MKNFVNEGRTVKHTAVAAITAGDVVVVNELVGIAMNDAAIGEDVTLVIEGTFLLTKDNNIVINQGDLVDFDSSEPNVNKGITGAAGDVTNFGIAMESKALADTSIKVKLIPGGGTFT